MSREGFEVIKQFAKYFSKILFTSEEELNAYCAQKTDLKAHGADLVTPEGEDALEFKDPKEHKYILRQLIGRNPTTAAFVAIQASQPSKKVVAKFVMLNDEKQATYARSELHCLAAFKSFGIVKHYDDFISDDKLLLIMEYASGGDLNRQIKERHKQHLPFQEHEAGLLFYQIVLALNEVHHRCIMHRDLKSANVFLMSTGIIKLGDFGFSKQYTESVSLDVGSSFCGTPYYLAPELWERKRYSKKADMWSLGVILYELLTLRRPFKGPSQREIMEQVLHGHYDPIRCDVSDSMKKILDSLLAKNPNDRPTTEQLLELDSLKYVANLFEEIVKGSDVIEAEDKAEILEQLSKSRQRTPSATAQRHLIQEVSHEGYLLKYSSDFKWKKRYFVLKGGSLLISLSDNPEKDNTSPKSTNVSTISDVFPAPEAYCQTHPHQLVIWFFNGQKIIAKAKSEEERDAWINKLHRACGM